MTEINGLCKHEWRIRVHTDSILRAETISARSSYQSPLRNLHRFSTNVDQVLVQRVHILYARSSYLATTLNTAGQFGLTGTATTIVIDSDP